MATQTSSNPFERVFACVGTTEFDELIRVLDTRDFLLALQEKECRELRLQIGRGSYVPRLLEVRIIDHDLPSTNLSLT